MSKRGVTRTALVVGLVLAGSSCVHGSGATSFAEVVWSPDSGPLCTVRVESAYDHPVEAGASAGARTIHLGSVDPGGSRDFAVPCAHRAVTIFRVARSGEAVEARLGAHSRALDSGEVTVVSLRPPVAGLSAQPRR